MGCDPGSDADAQQSANEAVFKRQFEICNSRGLHARASAKMVRCAEQFDAEIMVSFDGMSVPGTSIMGLMTLGARQGTVIALEARGRQAVEALDEIGALIAQKFGEE